MHLDLSADEAAVLADVLDTVLGEIREEIYKAEVTEYKASLKQREALLASVRSRLGAAQPAAG